MDSVPINESLNDGYECEVPVDGVGASANCIPMKGYMTAYLPNSSNTDKTEVHLLALIGNGMKSDVYTNDDVVRASYVGMREISPQDGQVNNDD
mmetsp:Transcript_2169/g.4739  ORF Transcript_2169/g.4739 Transcript_2169/m.4739 type:complete len:94 (+) Transcript_2169:567-848(+)